MPGKSVSTIQVVSHGPSCLDGVMAAAAVARFYDGHRVFTTLAGNGDADRTIQELDIRSDDGGEIWITDLSWNSTASADRLPELSARGAPVFLVGHHPTAGPRADAPA